VLGRRRFRIIETWDQDGYRIAKVQWLQDVIPAPGSPEQKEIDRMARTAAEVVNTFLTRAQDADRKDYHRRLRELLNQSEGRPNISDPECFSFWIANLLPIRTAERLQFLRLTDTRERLNQEILQLHRVSTDQGCYIQ
jgi:Lon protease-like protein